MIEFKDRLDLLDGAPLDAAAADWGVVSCGGRGAPVEVWDEDMAEVLWSGTLAYVTDSGWAGVLSTDGRLDEAPAWRVHSARGTVRS